MLTAAMGSGFRNSRNWLCSRDFGLSGLGIMEDRAIRWGLKSLFVYISIIITTIEALWLFEIFPTSTYIHLLHAVLEYKVIWGHIDILVVAG